MASPQALILQKLHALWMRCCFSDKWNEKVCLLPRLSPHETQAKGNLICVCCATGYTVPRLLEEGLMGVSFTSNAHVSSSATPFPMACAGPSV